LYDSLTDNSSEIECLFVERMKQLLKAGGWAGVILPSSVLSNGGIYCKTREIIFKYFNIKAIVELGSGTFMKTGTNTVVLFLERRSDNDFAAVEKAINIFVNNHEDVTVLGMENAFSQYVADVYDGLSFEDYNSLLNGDASDSMQKHELFSDYYEAFGDELYANASVIEKEKMLYFLLTHSQNIVLVKTGGKREEKNFLGYEFSERRGHEGIKHLPNGTKLYDENGDLRNPQKANSYIYNAFLGKQVEVDASLNQNITYRTMSDLIHYGTSKFDKIINVNADLKLKPKSRYPVVSVRGLSEIITKGTTPTTLGFRFVEEGINFIKIENITNDGEISGALAQITPECNERLKRSQLQADDILFSIAGSFGRIARVPETILPANTNQALAIIRSQPDKLNAKYFVEILRSEFVSPQIAKFAKGIAQYNISLQEVGKILIPLPPLPVQEKIAAEIEMAEAETARIAARVKERKTSIVSLMKDSFSSVGSTKRLGAVSRYSQERISCAKLSGDTYVGVDNLLQNLEGKRASQFVPSAGTATAYSRGDILLSNIRPYLKKIWLADNAGGSSGDVLVLKPDNAIVLSRYLFYQLAADEFFDYEMQHVKGQKMPRADKSEVLNYPVYVPSIEVQKSTLDEIEKIDNEIAAQNKELQESAFRKNCILKNYL
ncbi:MAG: N-6 DNA methylase, partial [Lachnospiraceae bacterium]|nr:N-6 DNA methylase [Lachnospiraceae bacterium]